MNWLALGTDGFRPPTLFLNPLGPFIYICLAPSAWFRPPARTLVISRESIPRGGGLWPGRLLPARSSLGLRSADWRLSLQLKALPSSHWEGLPGPCNSRFAFVRSRLEELTEAGMLAIIAKTGRTLRGLAGQYLGTCCLQQ